MKLTHIVIRPASKHPVPFVAVPSSAPNSPGTPHMILEGARMSFPRITIDTDRQLVIGTNSAGDHIFPLNEVTYTQESR